MAVIYPHLAMIINSDPDFQTGGSPIPYRLCYYDKDIVQEGMLVRGEWDDQIVSVYNAREGLNSISGGSPRGLYRTGYGQRLRIQATFEYRVDRYSGNQDESIMQTILQAMARPATGLSDTQCRYFWLSTNYNWASPAESWFRVEPDPEGFSMGYGAKTNTRVFTFVFNTALIYKAISWQYARRFASGLGSGTVSGISGTTTITGVGTNFLTVFKPGDTISVGSPANPIQIRGIRSIASNTNLTVALPLTSNFATQSYQWIQGDAVFYAPIYTFTAW